MTVAFWECYFIHYDFFRTQLKASQYQPTENIDPRHVHSAQFKSHRY